MHGLALCAGAGGLELGLKLALGEGCRTVCYVEREAYAAATLVARMADASLDTGPVWDDLGTFDGRPWRGVVDLVSAGFPCQPWSSAGRGRGTADERWLWPDIARIVREVRPAWVFLENSPRLVRGGLDPILRDLAVLGFDAEWDVFSAAEAGAPHVRKRLFVLANADSDRRQGREPREAQQERGSGLTEGGVDVADAPGGELGELRQPSGGRGLPDRGDAVVGDADRHEWGGNEGDEAGVGQRQRGYAGGAGYELGLFPPGYDDLDAWREVLARDPSLEPAVRRVADGLAHRLDRLRLTGNGVVPVVAAVAFLRLRDRFEGVTWS